MHHRQTYYGQKDVWSKRSSGWMQWCQILKLHEFLLFEFLFLGTLTADKWNYKFRFVRRASTARLCIRQKDLTLFLIKYVERLQKLMFGTLHHSQTGLPLILECPATQGHTLVRLQASELHSIKSLTPAIKKTHIKCINNSALCKHFFKMTWTPMNKIHL